MTDLDYREMGDDSADLFDAYMQYGFRPESGPSESERATFDRPTGARRGLFRPGDEEPVSVCRHYWLDATVRGESLPVAGLTSVITPPEHRREGRVGALLDAALAEYRDRGRHLSVLWPFDYGFYRAFGWETADEERRYECAPSALSFAVACLDGVGSFRRVPLDSLDRLAPVYAADADRYSLTIDRDSSWWRDLVCRPHPTEPFAYAWVRDGEPRAYLLYEFEGDYHDRTMIVREFGYADVQGLTAVLAFCHNHDSQADSVRFVAPDDPILFDLLTAPDEVDCEVTNGPMVRVVDAAATLGALSYPDCDRRLAIAVEDDVADWNDGTFLLDVAGGHVTCRPVADGRDPDARLDVAALAQLVVGSRSATTLARADRLGTVSPAVVDALAELFPSRTVFLREHF
jgi:predicted acetyltransferase